MAAQKILFDDEDYAFMVSYKEATGVSHQWFVTAAIKDYILKLKAEQLIKDLPYNNNPDVWVHPPYHRENEIWPVKSDSIKPNQK